MPSLARSVDQVVGTLARFLHFRRARLNTVADLGPYLGYVPLISAPPLVSRPMGGAFSTLSYNAYPGYGYFGYGMFGYAPFASFSALSIYIPRTGLRPIYPAGTRTLAPVTPFAPGGIRSPAGVINPIRPGGAHPITGGVRGGARPH